MPVDAILSIDQGTTNSKAILLDNNGRLLAIGSSPLEIAYPKPGWVEQSAEHLWSSVVNAIQQCVANAPDCNIEAIGISNQRESVVIWDAKSGKALAPVITWQCRRTAATTEKIKQAGHEATVLEKTGLPIDPLFPATKIQWLLNQYSTADTRIGTVDSWLIWKLTNGQSYATDRSNASRTQLLNVQTGEWDNDLCTLFGVDQSKLATVTNSKHVFGQSMGVPGVTDGVPIAAAMGDSHAALFGHAAFTPGEAKATFGTGSSIMMITPEFNTPQDGMTTTIAWSIDNKITYALEGNILVSASLFPWTATLLGLDGDVEQLMELATTVDHSNGVSLVPALVGLGAPHWNPQARGLLNGLSFSASPAHIAHAAALSMPLQAVDVFAAMYKQSSVAAGRVFVDGGPTRNTFLMQKLADFLNQPVTVCKDPELSALGAGLLAGLQTGFWTDLDQISALHRERLTIEPALEQPEREKCLATWHQAVSQCLNTSIN